MRAKRLPYKDDTCADPRIYDRRAIPEVDRLIRPEEGGDERW
jgi:hypothetical protein